MKSLDKLNTKNNQQDQAAINIPANLVKLKNT